MHASIFPFRSLTVNSLTKALAAAIPQKEENVHVGKEFCDGVFKGSCYIFSYGELKTIF